MNNKLSLMVNFIGVDKMSGALKNIVGLGGKGSKSLRALAGDSRKLSRDLQTVQREIAKGAGNVTDLVNRERALERQLSQTNVQLERQKRLAAIDAGRMAMQRRGDELKGKGRDNVVGGASLAAPMILAVKSAADFSSGMVDIQQKAELSDQATDRLANRIVMLSEAAKQMPENMRAGLDVLLGKGMNLDAATAAIGPAGRLATAYKVELTDAADSAFASISNLKVASGQTAQIFDAMAAAGNAGGFEVKDMARHFPSLTAQMQALGEKGIPAVADLSAALQVAMHTAGNADEAGNNIQNLLGKINAPGTIAAFKKNFGIDLPAAMKKLTDEGHSSMEAIALLTKKATGGDMKKLGFAFEDQQARMGILSLIQNMEEYRDIRRQAMQSGGTVDKAFGQRVARDATVQWRSFLGTASRLAIVLGTTLLPVITNVFGIVGQLVGQVAAWSQANPALAASIMKGAAALITLRMGLGVAQYALGAFIGPVGRVISIARQAAPVLGLLRTAAIFMGQGVMRAGAMMLANPIVLIITAIVVAVGAAAYLIYTHWDKISAAFKNGVAWVKGAIGGLPDWLKNIGSMMMSGLMMSINPMALAWRLLDVAKRGVTAFKTYLGIKSPSRLFMALGDHVAGGLERGIDGNRHGPARAAGRMAAGVAAAGAMAIAPAAGAGARGRGGPPDRPAGGDTYHFHIKQLPGEDAEALADRIIEQIEKKNERKRRRGFEDG
ncbi:phage tail tape measure protein [Sphingomonas bisphenolicum]